MRLDFDIPFLNPTSTVTEVILNRWWVTAQVGILTVLFAFGSGILMGVFAVYHRNSLVDNAVSFLIMLGVVVPGFVVALWLILIFAVRLDWVPMRGWSNSEECLIGDVAFCSDWILPVFAYCIGPMGVIGRYTRASVVDVMRQDYIRTARAACPSGY